VFVLLALASGCDGFPAAFAPSGQRVHVRVVGGQTVEVEGRTLAWTDFLAGVRQQVVEAEQGKTPRPWVVVEVPAGTDRKLVNRMLDDLHAAGVRSVDFGR
jgi:hypothetical protein